MLGLEYANHDGVALLADLYLPAGPGPHPVVVGITGGGWRVGSRMGLRGWGEYLAAQGYALLAIDHRKTTAGKMFPEAVCDVVAALQFVVGEAERLHLDPARIVMMGSSAGAHLAAMASLCAGEEEFAARYPADAHSALRPKVAAMVVVYGVYDLFAQWQHGLVLNQAPGQDRVERFLGATPYDDPDLYHRASPLRRIRYATNHVRSLVIWGDADVVVPPAQSILFADALAQAGHFVRRAVVPGAGHFWFTDDPIDDPHGHSAKVSGRIVRFLNACFPARAMHVEG